MNVEASALSSGLLLLVIVVFIGNSVMSSASRLLPFHVCAHVVLRRGSGCFPQSQHRACFVACLHPDSAIEKAIRLFLNFISFFYPLDT
jgi:hypothetical protein